MGKLGRISVKMTLVYPNQDTYPRVVKSEDEGRVMFLYISLPLGGLFLTCCWGCLSFGSGRMGDGCGGTAARHVGMEHRIQPLPACSLTDCMDTLE